jgi:ATP-dependent Clp protease ATP-binding subunit ClpA
MKNLKKIQYNDLKEEALLKKFPKVIGRVDEMERLTRIINRSVNNNIIIIGPSGIGKTTFVYGWIKKILEKERYKSMDFLQFETNHLFNFESNSEEGEYFKSITSQVSDCVIFIDNFGRNIYNNTSLLQNTANLYNEILKNQETRLVLSMEPYEYNWIENEYPSFIKSFEILRLKKQSKFECVKIIENKLPRLNKIHKIIIPSTVMEETISYVERFPVLGQLPQSAIHLIDEGIVMAKAMNKKVLNEEIISNIVSSKINIPKMQLTQNNIEVLKSLDQTLNSKVIGQEESIKKIIETLQRAKLGIRNPQKPLGSFLILGPSGVGKTETAKLISEVMFGRSESFTRFDMSEFGQEHTVARLIGAPAGYSGYENGGALTNALIKEPHSLILLDEIEKAHPKVFDIFLQVLDDGRITSGQNETVDACHSIVMATSNIGVNEILKKFKTDGNVSDEKFIQETIITELTKIFRLEFINRFDSILIFNPLTLPNLVDIAKLEVSKIEKRLSKHKVSFGINDSELIEKIKSLTDPRFGARPVKRLIEETCELLLVKTLLNNK